MYRIFTMTSTLVMTFLFVTSLSSAREEGHQQVVEEEALAVCVCDGIPSNDDKNHCGRMNHDREELYCLVLATRRNRNTQRQERRPIIH
jgi:hypothetical protein